MHGSKRDAQTVRRNGIDYDAPTVVLRAEALMSLRGTPVGARFEGGSTEHRMSEGGPARVADRVRGAMRSDRSLGLALAVAVASVELVVTLAGVGGPAIRALFALPLVVMAPGYALMAAACPGPSVSGAERLALSIGASLAATVVGGLLLHWTPWGLRADTWAVVLGGLTLTAAAVGLARHRRAPMSGIGATRRTTAVVRLGRGSVLLVATAGLILAATIHLARVSATGQADKGFSQVWMLPAEDAGQPTVRLGVHNREASETSYRLQLDVDGVPLASWPEIVLASGETWEATAALPVAVTTGSVAEARLYRGGGLADAAEADGSSAAYRRVVLRR